MVCRCQSSVGSMIEIFTVSKSAQFSYVSLFFSMVLIALSLRSPAINIKLESTTIGCI